jgi:uncharacterized damage-inducible protein DinB
MSISAETLRTQLAYARWATNRLLEAAAQLTPEELARDFATSDKSVVGTLAHTFAADRIWISRVKGRPPARFITPEDRDLAVLQREWPSVLAEWNEYAAGMTADSAPTIISYQDTKGNSYSSPLWQIVLHVVNHGTHHRGQVSGFLRAMGKVPPPLDLIAFYRE